MKDNIFLAIVLLLGTIVLTMRTNQTLANTLFSKVRGKVLAEVFGHPGEQRHLSQLARLCQVSKSEAQRELQALSKAGILFSQRMGNQVVYLENPQCPVLIELKALILKTWGSAAVLREAIDKLPQEKVRLAAVFGSVASGELKEGSDIDLLVLGDISLPELVEGLQEAQVILGREINPKVYSVEEWQSALKQGKHFAVALYQSRHQFLYVRGHERDFEAMAK
jgi:predicted nucleotidyltransferase